MAWPVDADAQSPPLGHGALAGNRTPRSLAQESWRHGPERPETATHPHGQRLSGHWPGTKPGLPQNGERCLPSAQEALSLPNTELMQTRPLCVERQKRLWCLGDTTSHVSSSREGTNQDEGPKANGEGICQPKITATHLLGLRRSEFASSPGQARTDRTDKASLPLSSQERQDLCER